MTDLRSPHRGCPQLSRRTWLAGCGAFLLPTTAAATTLERRLHNRLELWAAFSRKTDNVVAAMTTVRTTSLLLEPQVTTGTLAFVRPDTLVLRDDGLTGSRTRISPGRVVSQPNRDELPAIAAVTTPMQHDAAAWLSERLLRAFRGPVRALGQASAQASGREPDLKRDLTEGARVNVPRRSFRFELLPPRGSRIRQLLRSLTLTLDPVSGAIVHIALVESQGDRLDLSLTDHRQNVAPPQIDPIVGSIPLPAQ